MCICISVELWYPLCVCLRVRGCVFWIELWRCAISLTSTESHSSQLNHGNRLYGQKCCFSSVCVSVCVCMCVYETLCASPCVCDCGNSPDIYYSIGMCQREREVLSIHTFSALKKWRDISGVWCISDSFYLHRDIIFLRSSAITGLNLNLTIIYSHQRKKLRNTTKRFMRLFAVTQNLCGQSHVHTHRCACTPQS